MIWMQYLRIVNVKAILVNSKETRFIAEAQLHSHFTWHVPFRQKCEMCRCNMHHGSATISKFNTILLLDITATINKWMNSDINFLERSNETNLQSQKSRFVKCQIAATISRWRKTDRAITISIKTNNTTRNRGTCVLTSPYRIYW